MPTSYTSLLGLALPVTGELSGVWGDTVNDYITQYLDASVAGTQTISGSQTAVTLSKTTATSLSQAGSGATGSSQYIIINCTGNPASLLTITAPAASKPYIIINGTSTSQSVKIVGVGPTTGVTLIAGEKALVAWNGSDFVKIGSTVSEVTLAGNNAFTGANTFYNATGQTFGTGTSTQDGIILAGRAGGSSSYRVTLTPTTLTASRTVTLPDANTTIPVATQVLTFSGPTAARTITLPDANFTAARTDAGQTFTGTQTVLAAATQDAVALAGRAGGTSSYVATLTPATLTASRTVTIPNETFTIGFRNLPPVGTQTGSYTLGVNDVGKYVQVGSGGSITIPDATFAEGDAISIFNNTTGNITITCTITTAYIAGTNTDKATMTLATRGVATILFISGTVCVVSGNVT